MAFAMLQELGGIGGIPDAGTDDSSSSGTDNGVISALENVGVNFIAAAAGVGANALAAKTGAPPAVAPYSGSSFALRPGVNTAVGQRYISATTPNVGMWVGGALVVVLGLAVVFAALRR